jgi:hypothetical protein
MKRNIRDPFGICPSSGPYSLDRLSSVGLIFIIYNNFNYNYTHSPVYKTEINDRRGSAALTTRHPSIHNSWH